MKIGFVGAGKVGFSLGKYLLQNNIIISGYYSRTFKNTEQAADFTDSQAYDSIDELLNASDVIFITVNDSAISDVWNQIKNYQISGMIFCHCSGILTSELFEGADLLNVHTCSLHMLQAVSSKYESYKDMKSAVFTFESNDDASYIILNMISGCGNKIIKLETQQKIKYHTAASVTSNLVDALIHEGYDLLSECGFSYEDSKILIEPLVRNNIDNIFNYGTVDALTGPVERNDIQTVAKHISCLNGSNKRLYLSAALKLIEISSVKHPERNYIDMQMLLENSLKGEAKN